MAKGRVFLMEFIFISPRLMSLRHKDEAFLHIPFPIPYILHSISSEPALLLRLSLLLVLLLGEGTKKKKTGDLNIYFMSVCPFDTHLWHHASQFSFRLCSSICKILSSGDATNDGGIPRYRANAKHAQ